MDVGIGIIGFCGHWSTALPDWAQLQSNDIDMVLRGVASLTPESIPQERLQEQQSGFTVFDTWQELIADKAIDVVVVDGPFHLHAEMSIAAMQAGKHVFCEKLVALTWDDYQKLKEVQASTQMHFWAMMGLRYSSRFFTALQLAKSGVLGELRHVRMQKSYKLGTRPTYYQDRALYGGTIPWVGSHAVDLIYAIAGNAQTVNAIHQYGPDNYELAAFMQYQHDNGIISSASLDYYRPSGADSHSDDRLRIAGDQAIVEVIGENVTLIDKDGTRLVDHQEPDRSLFIDGINAIYNKQASLLEATDTLAVTRMCLAARDSADENGLMQRISNE